MRILVLDSALARCTAAVVTDDVVAAVRTEVRKQRHEAVLPTMARDVLDEFGQAIDLVAVTVGPGSFTGIRAALALAHGFGLALDVPVIGVTVGEAIADSLPQLGERALWVVTESRRGHIFLERDTGVVSLEEATVPQPEGKIAIAGAAAIAVAARLAARGANIMLTDARFAQPRHIAAVAGRRHAGGLPSLAAQPLYVDPPEAKPPIGGLRPPPEARSG
jgi:tRNA threonylcarbamoyladenosine biosynthesis protein TsaB